MLGVFSFHFCQSPIVFHGFGFCKYVYIGVSFFVSPLSFFKENHESNTEMKRPLLKWLMIILRLPHIHAPFRFPFSSNRPGKWLDNCNDPSEFINVLDMHRSDFPYQRLIIALRIPENSSWPISAKLSGASRFKPHGVGTVLLCVELLHHVDT